MVPICFASEIKLSYDANGNLVSGDGFFREYNGFNQLSKIYNGTNSSGVLIEEFIYHPTEERVLVKKIYYNNTLKETIYYVSQNFVRVVNSSGSYDFTYVYHEGQFVVQLNPDGSKLYSMTDHLGSTSIITNSSANVVEQTFYDPYGGIVSGGDTSRFDYEAKEYDKITKENDFHFRTAKPEIARFTQPDTLIQNVYDPQMLNRYAFERNNPYKYTDPNGHINTGQAFVDAWQETWRAQTDDNKISNFPQRVLALYVGKVERQKEIEANLQQKLVNKYYPYYYDSSNNILSSRDYKPSEPPSFAKLQNQELQNEVSVVTDQSGNLKYLYDGYTFNSKNNFVSFMYGQGFNKGLVEKTTITKEKQEISKNVPIGSSPSKLYYQSAIKSLGWGGTTFEKLAKSKGVI